jgi:hypothetical protein
MPSRPQWFFVSALLLAVALAGVTLIGLASKPLQIAWHRHKMQRAWDESQVAEDATESFTRLESHLEKLVSLGSVSKRAYPSSTCVSRPTNRSTFGVGYTREIALHG